MVAVIIVDADNTFRGVFEDVCKQLKITLWPLARGNHKGNSGERCYRFLNKTQTICGTDRDPHDTFATNIKNSQYAWDTVPIDNNSIPRCVATVGKAFKFLSI